jgi:hypothetical protein
MRDGAALGIRDLLLLIPFYSAITHWGAGRIATRHLGAFL